MGGEGVANIFFLQAMQLQSFLIFKLWTIKSMLHVRFFRSFMCSCY
jgi:hypothetical protein